MNKKITYTIILASIAGAMTFVSCDNSPKFHVEGTIEEAEDSMLYLEAMTLDGIQELDSTELGSDGEFSFSSAAPTNPEFYALRIGHHRINFSIDSTETVTFTAKLPTMSNDYTVKGSKNCQMIKEISLLQAQLQDQIIAIESNTSMYPGDIVDSVNHVIENYKNLMLDKYILQEPMEAYAYYAVCQSISDGNTVYQLFDPINNRKDVKCYAAVATAWDGYHHDAKRTEQLCNMAIQGMQNTAAPVEKEVKLDKAKVSEVGIIDISLPDINGRTRTLSSLKGKVVMLDFTVYGAKESPERTRHLRELYDKYKNRGFEIYQVSLDDDTHFWKYSCENIPWICVHETDGTATNLYGIKSVPTYFLINRKNELVVRSEMVKTSLEEELVKLL